MVWPVLQAQKQDFVPREEGADKMGKQNLTLLGYYYL